MTPGCGDAADPGAQCRRARPIIGHRQGQVQASLSDYADERADQPYMRAAASSARWRNLRQIGGSARGFEGLPVPSAIPLRPSWKRPSPYVYA